MIKNKSKEPEISSDKRLTFTIQQSLAIVFGIAALSITIGTSIYTFYNAIPQLDELNKGFYELDKNVAVVASKIEDLKERIKKDDVIIITEGK